MHDDGSGILSKREIAKALRHTNQSEADTEQILASADEDTLHFTLDAHQQFPGLFCRIRMRKSVHENGCHRRLRVQIRFHCDSD